MNSTVLLSPGFNATRRKPARVLLGVAEAYIASRTAGVLFLEPELQKLCLLFDWLQGSRGLCVGTINVELHHFFPGDIAGVHHVHRRRDIAGGGRIGRDL